MITMRALRFDAYGPPSTLSVEELLLSELRVGESLIRVQASAVNPSDVSNVAGAFDVSLPRVPGRDFAGTVVAGNARWLGKEVWGSGADFGGTRDGAHADFVAVPNDWLSLKPRSLSMSQAGAVGVPYVAAWSALVHAGRVQAGEMVLITGALGAVGRAATQIAHWKGATVIGADGSEERSEADVFVDIRGCDLPASVKALTDGRGADLVLDTVGGPVFEPAIRSLSLDGRQVVLTSVGNRRVEFDLVDFCQGRRRLIGVDTAQLAGMEIARILDYLRSGFDVGALTAPVIKTWPLDDAVGAYLAVEGGDTSARHVVVP